MSLNKYVISTIVGIAISLSVLATFSLIDQVYAAHYSYKAQLSGENEVPSVQTSATGQAEFTKPANDTIKYRVNITGLSNATMAHIHSGAQGKNGEPVVDLMGTPTSKDKNTAYGMIFRGNFSSSSLKGALQGKTLDDLAALMDSGKAYVNVHTADHKDGEIRGQLSNVDKPTGSTNSTSTNSSVGFSTLTE